MTFRFALVPAIGISTHTVGNTRKGLQLPLALKESRMSNNWADSDAAELPAGQERTGAPPKRTPRGHARPHQPSCAST